MIIKKNKSFAVCVSSTLWNSWNISSFYQSPGNYNFQLRVSYAYRTFSCSSISHSSLYTADYLSWKRRNNVPCICCLFMFFKQTKMLMGEVMREAAFSLAEAKFTAGDFRWGFLGLHEDAVPMGKSYQQIIFSFGKKNSNILKCT